MEKLIKSFGESQKPVTLYMDDIEKIIEIFEQVSKEVEISTTDYVIHDVNQLSELKQEFLTELDISIIEPHIALHLKPDSTWLYMNKDDLLSRGIFEKIKQILLKNKRPFSWLLQSFVILAVFFTISFFH